MENSTTKQIDDILNTVTNEMGFDSWDSFLYCFGKKKCGAALIDSFVRRALGKALLLPNDTHSCPHCGK